MIDLMMRFPAGLAPILFLAICLILLFHPKSNWKRAALYGLLVFTILMLMGDYVDSLSGGTDQSMRDLLLIYTLVLALLSGSFAFLLGKMHSMYLHNKTRHDSAFFIAGMGFLLMLVAIPFFVEVMMWANIRGKSNAHTELLKQHAEAPKKPNSLVVKHLGKSG